MPGRCFSLLPWIGAVAGIYHRKTGENSPLLSPTSEFASVGGSGQGDGCQWQDVQEGRVCLRDEKESGPDFSAFVQTRQEDRATGGNSLRYLPDNVLHQLQPGVDQVKKASHSTGIGTIAKWSECFPRVLADDAKEPPLIATADGLRSVCVQWESHKYEREFLDELWQASVSRPSHPILNKKNLQYCISFNEGLYSISFSGVVDIESHAIGSMGNAVGLENSVGYHMNRHGTQVLLKGNLKFGLGVPGISVVADLDVELRFIVMQDRQFLTNPLNALVGGTVLLVDKIKRQWFKPPFVRDTNSLIEELILIRRLYVDALFALAQRVDTSLPSTVLFGSWWRIKATRIIVIALRASKR